MHACCHLKCKNLSSVTSWLSRLCLAICCPTILCRVADCPSIYFEPSILLSTSKRWLSFCLCQGIDPSIQSLIVLSSLSTHRSFNLRPAADYLSTSVDLCGAIDPSISVNSPIVLPSPSSHRFFCLRWVAVYPSISVKLSILLSTSSCWLSICLHQSPAISVELSILLHQVSCNGFQRLHQTTNSVLLPKRA